MIATADLLRGTRRSAASALPRNAPVMRHLVFVLCLVITQATVATYAATEKEEESSVIRLDPSLDALVSLDAKIEKLAGNFGFTEGPVWVRTGSYLLFTDIRANVINRWEPKTGEVSPLLQHSGFASADPAHMQESPETGANGMTLDHQGRLVFCAQGEHAIIRLEKDGSRTALAAEYEGKRLNRTNDVVVKSDGAIYFSDPLPTGAKPTSDTFIAVYRVQNGKLQPVITDNPAPNGLAFSPDERFLYTNATAARKIFRHEIQKDGTAINGRLFFDMNGDPAIGGPDGMKVDKRGNLYSTGPGGIWILTPDGKHIGSIRTPEQASNLTFGDADGKTLYITARTGLYRIRLNVEGIRP